MKVEQLEDWRERLVAIASEMEAVGRKPGGGPLNWHSRDTERLFNDTLALVHELDGLIEDTSDE